MTNEERDIKAKQAAIMVSAGIVCIFINGWVFMKLWQWFVFEYYGQYRIGYSESCSVVAMFTFSRLLLIPSSKIKDDLTSKEIANAITHTIIGPLVILLVAWFVRFLFFTLF
jgi:hypothetical protein